MKKFDEIYEKLLNGLAKGMSLNDIADKHKTSNEELNKELEKGIEIEMEHTGSKSIAKEIAMDHLFEDPKYYTKLKQVEKK